jgi:hypothetical protein
VPVLVAVLAAGAVATTVRRWRRTPSPGAARPASAGTHELDPVEARRLDAELEAFDR